MRCPDCGKMVSYDTEVDPEEVEEPTMSADGDFTASYRRILACAECAGELKDQEFEFNENVLADDAPDCSNAEGHEWELDVNATPTMGQQTTDAKGKPIKNARYMKTLYGVEVTGIARCIHCGHEVKIELLNEDAASGFNELV